MSHDFVSLNLDLRFEDPGAAARGTLAWLRQLVVAELEAAAATAGGKHDDAVALCAGRPNHMTQVVFDVAAPQPELACETGHRSRLRGEEFQEMAAERHAPV